MKTHLKCAFREFRHRQGRTAVNIAGYAVAISVVVSLLTWMSFSRLATDKVLENVGAHFIGHIPAGALQSEPVAHNPVEGFVSAGVRSTLFSRDLVEKISQSPSVMDASPYLSFRIHSETDNHIFIIGGFDPSSPVSVGSTTCAPADIIGGRFIEPDDRGVVILESDYAVTQNLVTGDITTVGDTEMQVIGIVSGAVRPARADVYMHIEDARAIISNRVSGSFPPDSVNTVLIEATSARTLDAAMAYLGTIDPAFQAFGFACWRPAARALGLGKNAVFFLVGLILTGLFLFTAEAQFASVVERSHDIGILTVVGWSKGNIILQIVIESVIICLTGVVLGFITAALIVYLVPIQMIIDFPLDVELVFSPLLLFGVLSLSLLGGVLAGIYPALLAVRRSPAESLRSL